ncbi:hypothetical protein [Streptomyces sp. MH13]|uniref:hypothetical protein n=1 Tax=Streptomyces sp. MH13 TaxID=3417651 RepID=UPI003CF9D84A
MVKMPFGRVLVPFAHFPDRGAPPQPYAATDPSAQGGEFVGPDGPAELRGGPARVRLSPAAADAGPAR